MMAFLFVTYLLQTKVLLVSIALYCRPSKKVFGELGISDSFHPQQCSLFRSLLGLTGIASGVGLIVYLNPSVREYITKTAPQLKHYMSRMDDIVYEWKKKASAFELPALPSIRFFSSKYVCH